MWRRAPAVLFVLALLWASSPLWRITPVLPDAVAWLVPVGQAVFGVGVAGALVALLLIVVQGRRRRTATPSVLAVVTAIAVLTPVGVVTTQAGATPPPGEHAQGTLRVMALNTYYNQADDAAVAEETRRVDPDVLVLSETSPAEVAAVERATHMTATAPVPDNAGASATAILVRDVRDVRDVSDTAPAPQHIDEDLGLTGHQTPAVGLGQSDPVTVVGVHTRPPAYSDLIDGWQRDLERLGHGVDAVVSDGTPTVIAGDLNATVAHPEFRDLLDTAGMHRCGERGLGLVGPPTWPSAFPFVRIDHILVRGASCGDGGTVRVPGTDHLGVWADITPQ